jgi:uncharacterized protein YgiM (DUF1202 family)
MRKIHYALLLFLSLPLLINGQNLIESNIFEDGGFKTFVYQDEAENLVGEWFIYNTPTDSFLFAFGPIALSIEDNKYVQNGTWNYSNPGQIAKKVAYVLGDEHSSGLRSNFHIGQSYFPIALYQLRKGIKQGEFVRPFWSFGNDTIISEALDPLSLSTGQLNNPLTLNLPDLLIRPNKRKITPETFRLKFQFSPSYNSSKELFNIKLGSSAKEGYYLKCNGDGRVEFGDFNETDINPIVKAEVPLNINSINKLDIQINTEGNFVLLLNDYLTSSRNLENNKEQRTSLKPLKAFGNSIEIKESLEIELVDLSMLQFVEEPVKNTPGLLYRDICEIGLAVINEIVDFSESEVYMRELEISDLRFKTDSSSRLMLLNIGFPAKFDYTSKPQNLGLSIDIDQNNKIKKIVFNLNTGKNKTVDLKLLSTYLSDKFRANTYAYQGGGLNHNNLPSIQNSKSNIVVAKVETKGVFYELTAKTSLRTGPSASERVLLRFSEGDRVDLISKTNVFWWYVKYRGKVGYVKAALLDPISN